MKRFIETLFVTIKTSKQPKYPSPREWMNKLWYIHTEEYYSPIKKELNTETGNNIMLSGKPYL